MPNDNNNEKDIEKQSLGAKDNIDAPKNLQSMDLPSMAQRNAKSPILDKDELAKETQKRSYLTNKIEAVGLSRHFEPERKDVIKTSKEFTVQPGDKEESALTAAFLRHALNRPVRLIKGEESKNDDSLKIKPIIDEFILATHISDDSRLSQAEKLGLSSARENLSQATGLTGVLSNALHLARLYQHLRYIEEAKKATMLALGIDPDNQLGKQLFKELERVQQIDLGVRQIPMHNPISKDKLKSRIINLSGGSVIVIGDLLIDRLLEGKPERISREAPVLILEHVSTEHIPGGAANTAHNVTALGGKCHAIGICGDDEFAPKLAECLENHGITHALVQDKSRVTTVKTRIISKSHSLMQQLLRIDRISHEKISPAMEAALINKIEESVKAVPASAIILSDYKAGVITDGVINAVRKLAAERDLMIIVDAQGDFERFKNCTLMTPNQPDAEAYGEMKVTSRESLQKLGDLLLEKSGVKALLVTRGGEGMVLFQKGVEMFEIPAFNRSEVFDVTGAGDTVVATMSLALTSGATMEESMALGNLAASIVVRKPGTAVTSQKEMLDHLEKLNLPE